MPNSCLSCFYLVEYFQRINRFFLSNSKKSRKALTTFYGHFSHFLNVLNNQCEESLVVRSTCGTFIYVLRNIIEDRKVLRLQGVSV